MNSGVYLRAVFSIAPALAITGILVWQQRGMSRLGAMTFLQFVCLALLGMCGTGSVSRAASGLLLAIYSLLAGLDFVFFRLMGQSPGLDMVSLGIRERKSMHRYARGFVRAGDACVLLLLISAALLPALFPLQAGNWARWSWLPFLCGATGLAWLAWMGDKAPRPGGLINALCRVLRQDIRDSGSWREERGAQARWRHPFPGRLAAEKPLNVLTILNESLARNLCYGQGVAMMPAMQSFLRDNAENIFDFPLAFSNTTASDVSYPTIFSGLSPNETWARFEKNPLIWAAAKGSGYATSLHSTWDLNWGLLGSLVVDDHVDLVVEPEGLHAPLVNYGGMDDRLLTEHAVRHLESVGAPFFSVVTFNAQHTPCLADETLPGHDLKSCHGRYLNSLTILDGCFNKLIETLRRTGQLERTVILFMSDHGEKPDFYDNPSGNPAAQPRLDDFSHDTLSVPFWVYLPEGAMDASRRKAMRANQSRIVSNLDYYPTALAAMGIELEARDMEGLGLGGNDLTQPLPAERDIPCLNTGVLRAWSVSPVALASGDELLIYHEPLKAFELLNPGLSATTDLWAGASPEKKEMWMKRLAAAGLWPGPRYAAGPPEKAGLDKGTLMPKERGRRTGDIQENLLPVDIFKKWGGTRKGKTVAFDLVKASGHIVYGPNRWCPPGSYEALFDISLSDAGGNDQSRFVIEVTDHGDRFLAQRTIFLEESLSPSTWALPFAVTNDEAVLEFRIFADNFSAGLLRFSGVNLKRFH